MMANGAVGSRPPPYRRRWRIHLMLALIALVFLSLFLPPVVVVRTLSVFPADKEALDVDTKNGCSDPYNIKETPSQLTIRKNDLLSPKVAEQKPPLPSSRKDAILEKLKKQLFLARAYHPSISKLKSQGKLAKEMKQNIQEYERALSEASVDADLSPKTRERKKENKLVCLTWRRSLVPHELYRKIITFRLRPVMQASNQQG